MKKSKFLFIGVLSVAYITGCGEQKPPVKPNPPAKEKEIEDYEDDGSDHAMPQFITNNFGEDASTQLIVQWQNVDGSTNQRVQITTADDTDFTYAHNVDASYRKLDIDTSKHGNFDPNGIYKALVTDLEPGTDYIYRVGANDAWSDVYNHHTAEGDDTEFSFTISSDPQTNDYNPMKNTLTAANNYDEDHRFFFLCGDLVNEMCRNPSEIKDYTATASLFNKDRIIAATEGNHDTYFVSGSNTYQFGEATIFNTFTTFPDNGFVKNDVTKSNSYYFRYNNILLVSINTLIEDSSYAPEAEWLDEVLEANQDVDYTICTMHIGPFQSEDGSEWKEPNVRASFLPLFAKYKVDAVFYGHDHAYGRTNPIVLTGEESTAQLKTIDASGTPDGTVFSMVGATGPKFYDLGSNLYQDNIFEVRSEAKPGSFVNVKVTSEGLTVNAFRLQNNSSELTQLDSYTIPKKNK